MIERGAGLAAVVHDRLGVPDGGLLGVVLHSVADGGDDETDLLVVEIGPAAAMVGAEHEHLVDAGAGGLVEDRAEVLDRPLALPLAGGVEVRHHPHAPVAAAAIGLEGRRRLLLVARTERAAQVGPWRVEGWSEVARPGRPFGGDGDPATGEGVQAELAHGRRGARSTGTGSTSAT